MSETTCRGGILAARPSDLFCIAIVAVAVRLCVLIWAHTGPCAVADNPMAIAYLQQGYVLSAGWGYIRTHGTGDGTSSAAEMQIQSLVARVHAGGFTATPETAGPLTTGEVEPNMLHPPGMALLAAGLHRLVGGPVDWAVQISGLLLDVLAAALVHWIAVTAFSPRVGLFAGVAYALFPPLAYASISKMPDGMLGVFVAGSLALSLLAVRTRGWRCLMWHGLGGGVLGLGCYLRPDYAAMPLFMFLGLWACSRKFFPALAGALVAQAAVLLVLSPWAFRNHQLTGRWVFTSTGVGATLITGLGEFHNPWGFGPTDQDRAAQAAAAGLQSPWSSEADLYFRHLFRQSIEEKPLAYLATVIRRLPLAIATPLSWGYANPQKTASFTQIRQAGADRYQAMTGHLRYVIAAYWDVLLVAAVLFAGTLSVVVLFIAERRRWGLVLLVMSPHLYGIGSHLLTHLEPRFLLPSLFCWLIALCYVIAWVFRRRHPASVSNMPRRQSESA